jgi:hypothetical protein
MIWFASRHALLVALLGAAAAAPAMAQAIVRPRSSVPSSPVDPRIVPPPAGRPLGGLDQEKLSSYRGQIQSRMEQLRMSGRDATPDGAREMRNLESELGRVNGAMAPP